MSAVAEPKPRPSSDASWASSPSARKVMLGNRKRDTRPELAIRRLVHRLGLRYRVNARPPVQLTVRGATADLLFPRARVAVYIDGCFWHGCPQHFEPPRTHSSYWGPKIDRNQARDRVIDRELQAAGWVVLRIWEHEDPEEAARRVLNAVRGGAKP